MDFVCPGPAVYQTLGRSFATYSHTSSNITCCSWTTTIFNTKDFSSIHFPPGCTAKTDRFQLAYLDSAYTCEENA